MSDLIQEFFNYCELYDRYSDNTLSTYAMAYDQFIDYLDKDLTEVKQSDIDGFIGFLKEKNGGEISVNTIRLKVNALNTLFEFLVKRDYLEENPADGIELRTPDDKEVIILSQEEVDRMIANTPKIRNKAIIATMFATCMRVSELVELELGDFYQMEDDNNYMFHVRQGKGRKDRYVFIGGKYLGYLLRYLQFRDEDSEAMFVSTHGNKLDPNTVRYLVAVAKESAGIEKDVTPHTLRKSGISYLLSKGVDIYTVSQLAGHSSVQTTDRYYSNLSNSEKSKRILGAFKD